MAERFTDRAGAGRALAARLEHHRGPSTLVLGLPRGGVVVAAEIAIALEATLDAIVTRKIGAPGNPEYAIGAVAEGGEIVLNEREIKLTGIGEDHVAAETGRQLAEISRRVMLYRGGRPLSPTDGRTVIVVDDGVATGFTMLSALRAVRKRGAKPVVMAAPVIPSSTLDRLAIECDETAVLAAPEPFYAVGSFYETFEQVTDQEVVHILERAKKPPVA